MLHQVETASAKDRKRQAAQWLSALGWSLQERHALPDFATDWISEALLRIVHRKVPAAEALCMEAGRGRPSNHNQQVDRAAGMHALVACGISKEKSAEILCDYFKVRERSALVKNYNKVAKQWKMSIPAFWDRAAQKETSGTVRQLWEVLEKTQFPGVGFRGPGLVSSISIVLPAEFLKHVSNSPTFKSMVKK